MAAPTIEQIVLGIETRLKTITGLRVEEYVPDQINPPQAIVDVPSIPEYRAAMRRGIFVVEPTITVFASAATDRTGQAKLRSYATVTGASSIPAAIEADRTLGLTGVDCIVMSYVRLGLESVGALGYYAGVFQLRASVPGQD